MKTVQDKVAIVTGAGSGIGKAAAELLAREGAKVIVSDIDEAHGKAVAEAIRAAGGEAHFIAADTAKAEDHEALVKGTVERYGGLDIAVNNAGIAGPLAPVAEYPLDGWARVIGVNLTGVFYALRYQIPAMLAKGGSIINISSILGQVGNRATPAYVSAKHGVVGLTKTAALDYAAQGIRVNSIGPAYIKTPMLTGALDEQTLEAMKALHPIGRLGEPEEVAEMILWLASSKSSFVTGTYFAVDGGYLAQ